MSALVPWITLLTLCFVGYRLVIWARNYADDVDNRPEDLAAFRAMFDGGCFNGDEASRVKIELQRRLSR